MFKRLEEYRRSQILNMVRNQVLYEQKITNPLEAMIKISAIADYEIALEEEMINGTINPKLQCILVDIRNYRIKSAMDKLNCKEENCG